MFDVAPVLHRVGSGQPLSEDNVLAEPLLDDAPKRRRQAYMAEIPSALVTLITTAIYAVVYGGIVFQVDGVFGSGGPPNGVIIWMMASCVTQAAALAFSGMPFSLTQATIEMLPLYRPMMQSVATQLQDESSEAVLGTILVILTLTTLGQGILLALGGQLGVARWLRVVPVVVLKGALFGVALFLLKSGMESSSPNPDPMSFDLWPHWGLVILLGCVFFIVDETLHSPVAITVLLLIIAAVPQALHSLHIISLEEMRERGWLLNVSSPSDSGGTWYSELWHMYGSSLPHVSWYVVATQIPTMMGMWLTHVLCTLMDLKAIEIITQSEISLDVELRAIGLGNILSAMTGSLFPIYILCSQNVTAHKLGSRTRFGGFLKLVTAVPVMFLLQEAVPKMPCALPATVAFWLGLIFMKETIVDIVLQHSHGFDVVIVCIMAVVNCVQGLLDALLVGMFLAVWWFVFIYTSLSPVVKLIDSASFLHSNVHRPIQDMEKVHRLGHKIKVIHLEGYIMFGSSPQLLDAVRPLLEADGPTWIVLSFRSVMGLDYSATCDITALGRRAAAEGRYLILTELRGAVSRAVKAAGLVLPEVTDTKALLEPGLCYIRHYQGALKCCEDCLLRSAGAGPRNRQSIALSSSPPLEVLKRSFGDYLPDGGVEQLFSYFKVIEYPANEVEDTLWRAGDEGQFAIGVVQGTLHALNKTSSSASGEEVLMEVVLPGSFVGFMSMLGGMPRSQTVKVPAHKERCVVMELSKGKYEELNGADPRLANALLRGFLRRSAIEWQLLSRLAAQV